MRPSPADHRDVQFNGFFGIEMRNITFAGERAAAEETLARYQTYQVDDRRIRALAQSGKLPRRSASTPASPGDSNYAYDQYDRALGALIDINTQAFGRIIGDGERELRWRSLTRLGFAVLVAGLVLLGIRPRLAEYR